MKHVFLCFLFFVGWSGGSLQANSTDTLDLRWDHPIPENGEYVQLNYADGTISSRGYMVDGEPEGWWKSYDKFGHILSEGNRINHQLEGLWTFYKEGKKISEISYQQGKKNGPSTYYNSQYIQEEDFVNDVIDGFRRYYDTQRRITQIIPFKKNREQGLAKTYHKEGYLVLLVQYDKGVVISRETLNQKDVHGKKQGSWKELYPNDRIYWEIPYKDDLKNGYYKEYDTAGNIIKIEKYVMGVLEADAPELAKVEIYTEYYANGKARLKVGYKNGKPEGICREYDSITGKVLRGTLFKNGEIVGGGIIDDNGYFQDDWKEYYPDGVLKSIGRFKKGQKSGEWKFYYPDGALEEEGSFVNGKYDGRWVWYFPNGETRLQQEYYQGLPDGEMQEFDEKGKRVAFGKYVEGLEEGPWQYVQGEEKTQGKYKGGEKSGLWKSSWSSKGNKLSFRGSYIDGLAHGTHYYYWENGNLREEVHYTMGRRVGTCAKYDPNGQVLVRVTYNQQEEEIKYNGKRTLTKEEEREEGRESKTP